MGIAGQGGGLLKSGWKKCRRSGTKTDRAASGGVEHVSDPGDVEMKRSAKPVG